MKIVSIVGARPNFVKLAAVTRAVARSKLPIEHRIINTNQHTDKLLNADFFNELGIQQPEFTCRPAHGSSAERLSAMTLQIASALEKIEANWVLVYGDVLSTLSGALAAKLTGHQLAHYGSGVRSRDRFMPEELNRRIVDSITDLHLVTHESATQTLKREGVEDARIFEVGNLMVDSLLRTDIDGASQSYTLPSSPYVILTLHRPETVDAPKRLYTILNAILDSCAGMQIVFPIHPRTRDRLALVGFDEVKLTAFPNLITRNPLPYLELMTLLRDANLVVTDSAGLREEAFALNIPCVTVRERTEWPDNLVLNRNRVAGYDPSIIKRLITEMRNTPADIDERPESWDGRAAERLLAVLLENMAA